MLLKKTTVHLSDHRIKIDLTERNTHGTGAAICLRRGWGGSGLPNFSLRSLARSLYCIWNTTPEMSQIRVNHFGVISTI